MAIKKHITINDIAREAGVSLSTVSRVLNGTKPVAPEKCDAVLAAVENLNYHPSIFAQGLARGKSSTVGVLTQNLTSMFYGEIMHGIEEELYKLDYHPVFASGNWRVEEEERALEVLIARRVDALIVLGGQLTDSKLLEVNEDMPVVAVGRYIKGAENQCIQVENYEGAYMATKHLIDLGHKHIAHISGDLLGGDSQERHRGFLRALAEADLVVDSQLLVQGDFREKSGMDAIDKLFGLPTPPTAIFVSNDQMVYGAYLGLYRHGLRIPDDVSIIGFDDQPVSAYIPPPLTTIRQPCAEMGVAAANAIVNLLEGKSVNIPLFSTQLIIRESTAKPRA